ncbi:sulfur carrier protein ThiS [Nocardioides sp.]|uniref:sulfur carrier protein ThiS n=1 Tax=Nocardioides sp. TaxID=35761 RepID=UPI002C9D98E4|nr:sulfur carrier protein ThiS [Nocardioides sp.]HXH77640.1 sulfur carrier protein ThiS [Nocardioides sp.]
MRITLNGADVECDAPTITLLLGDVPIGCAVAVNHEVVPRSVHHTHPVNDGDTVEVVAAVAGG